jgi:predicted small secreted protein
MKMRLGPMTSLLAAASALSGCNTLGAGEEFGSSYYSLVRVQRVSVGDGSLIVSPPRPWNRQRPTFFDDIRDVEDWTLNGPYLDGISFVTGLKSGRYLIRQSKRADQQVPKFRSDMTPPEIAAMLESLYRVKGGAVDFRTLSLQPRPFLNANGFQLDYEHLDSDELWRRGRAVGAVINGELYLILFDAARSHYYGAALPDYESIVASAGLRY